MGMLIDLIIVNIYANDDNFPTVAVGTGKGSPFTFTHPSISPTVSFVLIFLLSLFFLALSAL